MAAAPKEVPSSTPQKEQKDPYLIKRTLAPHSYGVFVVRTLVERGIPGFSERSIGGYPVTAIEIGFTAEGNNLFARVGRTNYGRAVDLLMLSEDSERAEDLRGEAARLLDKDVGKLPQNLELLVEAAVDMVLVNTEQNETQQGLAKAYLEGNIISLAKSEDEQIQEVGQMAAEKLKGGDVQIFYDGSHDPEAAISGERVFVPEHQYLRGEPIPVFSGEVNADIHVPPGYMYNSKHNQLGGVATVGLASQLRDLAMGRVKDTDRGILPRARALQAHFMKKNLKPNDMALLPFGYQNILRTFPDGMTTLAARGVAF